MLHIAMLLIVLVIAAPPALAEASRDCASDDHELAIPACTLLIKQDPKNAVAH